MSNPGIKIRSFPCRVLRGGFWQPIRKQPTQEKSEHSQRRVEFPRLSARALMDREYLPMSEVGEHIRPNPEEYKVTLTLIRSATSACKKGADMEGEVRKLTAHLDLLVLVEPAPRHCLHLMDEAFDELIELMRQKGLSERVEWWKEMLYRYFEVFVLH